MKSLLCVVLVAFVVQVSAQNRPTLRCLECDDCPRVAATTARRNCYETAADPTLRTNPATIPLTPTTVATTVAGNQQQAPVDVVNDNNSNFESQNVRFGQLYTCYTIRRQVGDRQLTSRGCALLHQNEEQTCRYNNQGEPTSFCQLCSANECNVVDGVTKAFASMFLIFAMLFITLRFF